jgi:hypothetical protein
LFVVFRKKNNSIPALFFEVEEKEEKDVQKKIKREIIVALK